MRKNLFGEHVIESVDDDLSDAFTNTAPGSSYAVVSEYEKTGKFQFAIFYHDSAIPFCPPPRTRASSDAIFGSENDANEYLSRWFKSSDVQHRSETNEMKEHFHNFLFLEGRDPNNHFVMIDSFNNIHLPPHVTLFEDAVSLSVFVKGSNKDEIASTVDEMVVIVTNVFPEPDYRISCQEHGDFDCRILVEKVFLKP